MEVRKWGQFDDILLFIDIGQQEHDGRPVTLEGRSKQWAVK